MSANQQALRTRLAQLQQELAEVEAQLHLADSSHLLWSSELPSLTADYSLLPNTGWSVLERLPIALLISRLSDNTILYANAWAQKLLDFQAEADGELIGHTTDEFYELAELKLPFHKSGSKAFSAPHKQWQSGLEQSWQVAVVARRKNNSQVKLNLSLNLTTFKYEKVLITVMQEEASNSNPVLQESQKLFYNLAELGQVGLFRLDQAGRYSYVNERWNEITGAKSEQVNETAWLDLVYIRDRERVSKEWQLVVTEKKPLQAEYRFEKPDGTICWLYGQTVAEYSNQGELTGFIGTITDITERKEAEEALYQSEARLRSVISNFPLVLFAFNTNGVITLLEGQGLAAMGRKAGETVGQSFYQVYQNHPEIIHNAKRALGGETVWAVQTMPYGRSFDTCFTPVLNQEGQVSSVIGLCLDITERLELEQALSESEARYRAISEMTSDFIYASRPSLDDTFQIEWVSDAFYSVSGYRTLAELNGAGGWKAVVHPDDWSKVQETMATVKPGELIEQEFRMVTKNGQIRWLRHQHRAQWNQESGQVSSILSAAHDVTEHKQIESRKALQYAVTQVLAEAQTVDQMVYRILEVIKEALECEVAQFWKIEQEAEDKVLHLVASNHLGTPLLTEFEAACKQLNLAKGAGLAGQVWAVKAPQWLGNFHQAGKYPTAELSLKAGFKTALGFPVVGGNEVLGVMEFLSTKVQTRESELLELLANIGRQLGLFIERKWAEEALAENERRFRSLVESLQVGVLLQGPQAEIIVSNQVALDLLGLDEDQLLGRTSFDPSWNVIHEDGSPFPGETHPVPLALATGQPVKDVVMGVWRPKNGDRAWLLVNATPQQDLVTGQVSSIICTFTDITARRQTEEALRQSEARLQAILDNAPFPIFMKDRAGRYLVFNRYSEMVTGLGRAEILGKTDFDLAPPEVAKHWFSYDQAVLASGQALEWEEQAPQSAELKVEITTKFPLFDNRGEPYAVVGICKDITERKRAEEALAAEKERLAVTLSSITDGVITTDKNGKVLLINRAGEELTGFNRAEAFGEPLSKVFQLKSSDAPPDGGEGGKEIYDPLKLVIQTNQAVELRSAATLVAAGGQERLVSGTAAPILDSAGQISGLVIVFRDITDKQRLAEEQLKASKLEALGLLAGGIAHDFNNILTSVVGNLSLARLYWQEHQEEALLDCLKGAEQACLGAKELTSQLLTFARGGAPIKEAASLAQIIEESAQFVLRGSKVQATFSLPANLWPVEVDKGQFSQVIQNLILNSIQATSGGGKLLVEAHNITLSKKEARTKGLAEGYYVGIKVQDWGEGISASNLTKIFDPYFTTKATGSGLGLAICYSIMRKHQGLIEVVSELGVGSSFYLYLPAKPQSLVKPSLEKGEGTNAKKGVNLHNGTGRLLIMDDEPTIRRVLKRQLNLLGYEVEEASDGQQTLQLYREAQQQGKPFVAVIMDLTIAGGMGGKETITQLLRLDPGVKAIVSSGYANDPLMAHYNDYGFKGLVAKPYRMEELARVVAEVVEVEKESA